MNCRDFISEFEERRDLSAAARFHLNDCVGCQKISHTQIGIWESIDNLAKVDAPTNFEFGVKARIANAAPNNLQSPQFLPVLRYVLPFSAIVLIVGLLAFNTAFFFGNDTAPQFAQAVNPQPEIKTEIPISNFVPPASAPVENTNVLPTYSNEAFVVKTSNQNTKPLSIKQEAQDTQFAFKAPKKPISNFPKTDVKANNDNHGGGSIVSAGTLPKVLMPEGFNQATPIENPVKINGSASTGVDNIWSLIGIELASENGKRVVKSVKQNSTAARNNIKVGDIIEAVDGVKISNVSATGGKIEVKTLTVLRGTEKFEISLKN